MTLALAPAEASAPGWEGLMSDSGYVDIASLRAIVLR
jgi:hypothetical protein